MSRGLWFVAGAGAGVYAMVRGRRAAEAFTPDGLRDRVGAAVVGARLFRDEVAQGRADTEPQMRRHLGLVSDGAPALAARGVSNSPTSSGSSINRGSSPRTDTPDQEEDNN